MWTTADTTTIIDNNMFLPKVYLFQFEQVWAEAAAARGHLLDNGYYDID